MKLFAALTALLCSAAAMAGNFSVSGDKNDLVIKYNDEILVKAVDIRVPAPPTHFEHKVMPDGSQVWNAWNDNPEYKYRREIALRADNCVEISLSCDIPIFNSDRVRGLTLTLPYSFVEGGKYRALTTNGRSWKPTSGAFTADLPNRAFPDRPYRFMTLEKENKNLIFDFNPIGAGDYCLMYSGGAVRGVWNVERAGQDLKLSIATSVPVANDFTGTKIIIREGRFEDYDSLHAQRSFSYGDAFKPLALYSFGDNKVGNIYTPINLRTYSKRNRAGWVDSPELKTFTSHTEGAYYSHMAGKNATFRRSRLAPGFYIITVGAGNGSGTENNFSISVNGEVLEKNISVKPGTVHVASKTFHINKDGILDVKFDGNFIVSAIGIQFLTSDAEDFFFNRGFWVSDGFEPASIYRNIDYKKRPVFPLAADTFVLPQPGKEAANAVKNIKREVCLPATNSPQLAWLPSGNWFKMLSNSSSLSEADTPEKVEKLIQSKIAGKKYDAVMISGMHSRHTYINHVQRGIDAFKVMADAAHRHNLKVIDHHDATLCWNVDAGLRSLAELLPEACRNSDTLLPSYQLCPSDPAFCERYYAYLTELVKNGVDGFQIDELVYWSNGCVCQHCREKFYNATGCYYPVNELDKTIERFDSEVMRQWFEWRKAAIADWFVELRKRCMPYNKNLVLCMYTTHWGFTRSHARYRASSCLFELARSINYFGTEVMTRNPLMTYRSLLPYRRMKNVLTLSYNTPIWAWVYASGHPRIYAGWAISNMSKQVALLPDLTLQPGQADFMAFDTSKENMPRTGVQAHTKVALLFSQASRDWNSGIGFENELFGLAQSLDAEHVSYEFICDLQLNAKDLARYKVLYLATNTCISDEAAQVIKDFARNGGTVVLTSIAGSNDEMGRPRKEWLFKDVFQFAPRSSGGYKATALNGKKLAAPQHVWALAGTVKNVKYFAEVNNTRVPLVVEAACGKGKMIYVAAALGAQLWEREGNQKTASRAKDFDPAVDSVYRQIMTEIAAPGRVWNVNAPEKVVTALWSNDKKIYIHFFNATGVTVKGGDKVDPLAPREPYPALTGDITFTLKNVKNGKVIAYSPDFAGGKELKSVYSNGDLSVTLSKELLKTYTLIHVEQ
ncbi:MAG: hypothetical protein E7047_02520 [Lentisphaerae bacterium]|nr:hypothetical protein [Lentisphaerota bacterium]